MDAPALDYRPKSPKAFVPNLGLIGCGGITKSHLGAYKRRGWEVVAMCDIDKEAALGKQKEYFPKAKIYEDYKALLQDRYINVVDVAIHPEPRFAVIEMALKAKKHVLSQKPYVINLEDGKYLARLADENNVKLAVNQNGRWAPYVKYANILIEEGMLGDVQSVNIQINWDHTWIKGTAFESVQQIILYDFAIHWFDMTHMFFDGQKAKTVFASTAHGKNQDIKPPLIANASIQYENGVANLSFDGHSKHDPKEVLVITGTKGTFRASGDVCCCSDIAVVTEYGEFYPKLDGAWFESGFEGTMGELLCAIEESREPSNSAWNNLESLEICFAAIRSANEGNAIGLVG